MEKLETYNVSLEVNGKALQNVFKKIEAISIEQAKIIAERDFPGYKAISATKIG